MAASGCEARELEKFVAICLRKASEEVFCVGDFGRKQCWINSLLGVEELGWLKVDINGSFLHRHGGFFFKKFN